MSNRLAVILGVIVIGSIIADQHYGWGAGIFLGQKLLGLLDSVAIWH